MVSGPDTFVATDRSAPVVLLSSIFAPGISLPASPVASLEKVITGIASSTKRIRFFSLSTAPASTLIGFRLPCFVISKVISVATA